MNAIQPYMKFLEKCHEVAVFCRTRGKDCFEGWPDSILLLYVAYHAMAGSLFVQRVNGSIVACGFAWPECAQTIRERFHSCKPTFQWHVARNPDCIFIAEIVADRETCRKFLARAKRQWPTFNRFMTFRRMKLVEVSRQIERFA